jgi:hypothetical protein
MPIQVQYEHRKVNNCEMDELLSIGVIVLRQKQEPDTRVKEITSS